MPSAGPRVSSVVEAVAACIAERYVFADAGARVAAAFRQAVEQGRYAGTPYGPDLAKQLTARAQDEVPDSHLQVRWSGERRSPSTTSDWDDPAYMAAYWERADLFNQGLKRAERLAGNVRLLVVANVDEPEGTAGVIDAAFAFLARCSALIIDLRRTTGGAPSGIAYFLNHLLPPGTPLIEVVNRAGLIIESTATAAGREPTLAAAAPVYVLTSRRTVSGCEELAYDLRAAGRATLVGETTVGGANPVDAYVVDPHVVVRVPTAYVRHVSTGGNWEGTGIAPDVPCPADDALDVAHRLTALDVRARVDRGEIIRSEGLLEELADVITDLDTRLGLPEP